MFVLTDVICIENTLKRKPKIVRINRVRVNEDTARLLFLFIIYIFA